MAKSKSAVLDPPECDTSSGPAVVADAVRQPKIGDVVHFVSTGTTLDIAAGKHRAATVIDINAGGPLLLVHSPARDYRVSAGDHDVDGVKPGTWHWPE